MGRSSCEIQASERSVRRGGSRNPTQSNPRARGCDVSVHGTCGQVQLCDSWLFTHVIVAVWVFFWFKIATAGIVEYCCRRGGPGAVARSSWVARVPSPSLVPSKSQTRDEMSKNRTPRSSGAKGTRTESPRCGIPRCSGSQAVAPVNMCSNSAKTRNGCPQKQGIVREEPTCCFIKGER
ncbi:hypothetical protein T439DRAFT_67683 [Meredithblackwellia eburnea MCA 4105]